MIYAVREKHERELFWLESFVRQGSVFVDGGANCGVYTVAASKLVGSPGRVLSFEPGADSYSVLCRNIEMNNLQNVQGFRLALSTVKIRLECSATAMAPIAFA